MFTHKAMEREREILRMDDQLIGFEKCPRCGEFGLEHLETYSHCVNCFYFRDYETHSPALTLEEIDRLIAKLEKQKAESAKICPLPNQSRNKEDAKEQQQIAKCGT